MADSKFEELSEMKKKAIIVVAYDFVKNAKGYKLDYSEKSLVEAERYLEDHKLTHDDKELLKLIYGAGSYVGEVIRKEFRGVWIKNDQPIFSGHPFAALLIKKLGNATDIRLYPFNKVFKRIESGENDGVDILAPSLRRIGKL